MWKPRCEQATKELKFDLEDGTKREIEKKTTKLIEYLKDNFKEPARLHQEISQILQSLDNSIEQEGNLLNQRLNLFLLVQTFLIAGYIQSLALPLTLTVSVIKCLAGGIAFTGLVTSSVSVASVKLSNQAAAYYYYYYEQLKEKSKWQEQKSEQDFQVIKTLAYYLHAHPPIYINKDRLGNRLAQQGCLINNTPWYFCLIWLLLFLFGLLMISPQDTANTLLKSEERGFVIIEEKYKGNISLICKHKILASANKNQL